MTEDLTPNSPAGDDETIDEQAHAAQARIDQLVDDAFSACETGDFASGVTLWTEIINTPGLSPEDKASACFNRGLIRGHAGDADGEIHDYTTVIEMPDATSDQKAQAFVNRGRAKGESGDITGEIADYTIVIDTPDAPASERASAYFNRGMARNQLDDTDGEIADYTSVIEMPDSSPEHKADAYINRGTERLISADIEGAVADYAAVTEIPDAPDQQKALAFGQQGWINYPLNRFEESIGFSQKAVDIAPDHIVVRNNLALALIAVGRAEKGLEQYKMLIEMIADPDLLDETTVEDLQLAVENYPDIPEFQAALEMVQSEIAKIRADNG